MLGRIAQKKQIDDVLKSKKAAFIAVSGRRRVGKTYLVDSTMGKYYCFSMTGIQNGDLKTQIRNFSLKLSEYSNKPIVTIPNNWQEAFILLKQYLVTLPKNKKQVLFFDELPWISTHKSGFIQVFAHLWNDFLSKNSHFVLVVCGSATSWMTKRIMNDKGGLHNRITHLLHLKPFTIEESIEFLKTQNIRWTPSAYLEIYMMLGGIPYYLEHIKPGDSPATAINRICFGTSALLKNEYQNLYKALFNQPENHEAIVKILAQNNNGLTREAILKSTGIEAGGPFTRAMDDLLSSDFVEYLTPFGKKKKGMIYRLVDEFSIFYNKFMVNSKINDWIGFSNQQKYRIWSGYAFENFCYKHVYLIKKALGIEGVYTNLSSYYKKGDQFHEGFQIDLVLERKDNIIHLFECKYHSGPIRIDKKYAKQLQERKSLFIAETQSSHTVYTSVLSNLPILENEYSQEVIDVKLSVSEILK
jgi:uncharacterized protein